MKRLIYWPGCVLDFGIFKRSLGDSNTQTSLGATHQDSLDLTFPTYKMHVWVELKELEVWSTNQLSEVSSGEHWISLIHMRNKMACSDKSHFRNECVNCIE